MLRTRTALVLTLFSLTALAGCIADEAPKQVDDALSGAADALPTADTGSITGQVVTLALDEVEGAQIGVRPTQGGDEQRTTTDKEGKFTVNGLAPGKYRVTVSDTCCKAKLTEVEVHANRVTDVPLQIEELTAADLGQPYQEYDSWSGFMSCGIGSIAVTWATCSTMDGTVAEDPNQEFLTTFNVTEGLEELVVAVDWDPVGGFSGSELWIVIERDGCDVTCESSDTYYENTAATPGIIIKIEDGPGDLAFDNITGERTIQVRVFPGGDANVMYQQPFKVHWHEFYNGKSADDFNPIPDSS